jgi:hypothetical protein
MKKKQIIIDLDTIRDMSKRFFIYLNKDYPLIFSAYFENISTINSFNFISETDSIIKLAKKDKSITDKKLKKELSSFSLSEFVDEYILQIYGHSDNTDIDVKKFMGEIINFRLNHNKYELTILVRNYVFDVNTINTKGAMASLLFISTNFSTVNNVRIIYSEKAFKKEIKSLTKDSYFITSDTRLENISPNIKIISKERPISTVLNEIN